MNALKSLGEEYHDRIIAVMVPEIVERRCCNFLFRHRSTLVKALLRLRGGPRIAIIFIPWYVDDAAFGKELDVRATTRDSAVAVPVVTPEVE